MFQVSKLLCPHILSVLVLATLLFSLWTRQTHKLVCVFSCPYDTRLHLLQEYNPLATGCAHPPV